QTFPCPLALVLSRPPSSSLQTPDAPINRSHRNYCGHRPHPLVDRDLHSALPSSGLAMSAKSSDSSSITHAAVGAVTAPTPTASTALAVAKHHTTPIQPPVPPPPPPPPLCFASYGR
ncbi:unnamed protein product, partial [Ectocarpus sp. 12 AP-2014]